MVCCDLFCPPAHHDTLSADGGIPLMPVKAPHQAEIPELGLPVVPEEYVPRLHVPVDDALGVKVVEAWEARRQGGEGAGLGPGEPGCGVRVHSRASVP